MTKLWAAGTYDIEANTPKTVVNNEKILDLLAANICCNSVGEVDNAGATDKAMLKLMDRWGFTTKIMREKYPMTKESTRFQFDSTRKRISTIVEDKSLSYSKRMFTKGASETIIENCTHYLDKDGSEKEISDAMRTELGGIIIQYAEKALRTIGLAYRDLKPMMGGEDHCEKSDSKPYLRKIEEVADGEKGFTLIGIAGIMDIIRPAVPDAVE